VPINSYAIGPVHLSYENSCLVLLPSDSSLRRSYGIFRQINRVFEAVWRYAVIDLRPPLPAYADFKY